MLLQWSLPRAKLLQVVAFLTARDSPTSVPSHLRAACCGMHKEDGCFASLEIEKGMTWDL